MSVSARRRYTVSLELNFRDAPDVEKWMLSLTDFILSESILMPMF
jgi:hypothetical protein